MTRAPARSLEIRNVGAQEIAITAGAGGDDMGDVLLQPGETLLAARVKVPGTVRIAAREGWRIDLVPAAPEEPVEGDADSEQSERAIESVGSASPRLRIWAAIAVAVLLGIVIGRAYRARQAAFSAEVRKRRSRRRMWPRHR